MSASIKPMTQRDADQATRSVYNDINATLGVDGFLTGLVGRQITQTIATTTIAGDTAIFSFYEAFGATLLYTITIIYTDGTQATLLSATRTA